jgi:hypothetical protein
MFCRNVKNVISVITRTVYVSSLFLSKRSSHFLNLRGSDRIKIWLRVPSTAMLAGRPARGKQLFCSVATYAIIRYVSLRGDFGSGYEWFRAEKLGSTVSYEHTRSTNLHSFGIVRSLSLQP